MSAWFVVCTQPGREARALQHLKNQGFDVYLPRYRRERRHARKVDVVLAPLFPRYLFVNIDITAQRWRSINGTVGVSHIISSGETPLQIPAGIVEEILSRENEFGAVSLAPKVIEKGKPFRITQGAMADQIGLFEEMADGNRAVLLLDLLGRQVRVKAPLEALAAAS